MKRFQNLSEARKILSLSFWRDEEAIQRRRGLELNRAVRLARRERVFDDYHLCIAYVLRDYSLETELKHRSTLDELIIEQIHDHAALSLDVRSRRFVVIMVRFYKLIRRHGNRQDASPL